jgi:hypothetical protein
MERLQRKFAFYEHKHVQGTPETSIRNVATQEGKVIPSIIKEFASILINT